MKRRWFQLHLSTCIVLMFVAGGFLWLNTRPRATAWGAMEKNADGTVGWYGYFSEVRGWPAPIYFSTHGFHMKGLMINMSLGAFALGVVAGTAEYVIRRGEACTP